MKLIVGFEKLEAGLSWVSWFEKIKVCFILVLWISSTL